MIVTDIGYGQWLDAPAAASFFRVCKAIGRRLDVNEAGRTWEQQNKFRQDYLNGVPGAAFALPAGTSIHEQGRAIDTDDRFIDLMADHGWIRTALARNEPWHFEYFIEHDNHRHETASSGSTPFPEVAAKVQEDDMRAIKSPNRPWRLIGAGYERVLNDEEAGNTVWPQFQLNDRQYDLNLSSAINAVNTTPVGNAFVGKAPNRPYALFTPGYVRELNDEERGNLGFSVRTIDGSDRQYDLWRSIALAGVGTSSPAAEVASPKAQAR